MARKAAAFAALGCLFACVAGDATRPASASSSHLPLQGVSRASREMSGRMADSSGFIGIAAPRTLPARSSAVTRHARHIGPACSAEGHTTSPTPRRALLQGLAAGVAALGLGGPAGAAAPNLDPRNAAGVGLNSNLGDAASGPFSGAGESSSGVDGKGMPTKKKPKAGSAAANLQIFQDDVLGYAFAMPPSWKGESRTLDSGGQILAFVDDKNQGKTDAIVTVVAQPTKLETVSDMEQAISPKGETINKQVATRDGSYSDGSVIIFETKDVNKAGSKVRVQALFCLRVKPEGNWLVAMTTQASDELYPNYIEEYKGMIKSFRPTYPKPSGPKVLRDSPGRSTEVSDDELGVRVQDAKLDDVIKNMPFGGK